MRTKLFVIAIGLGLSLSSFADQYVNGYIRKDGTYVQPYIRSDANDTRNDNYSTRGNINPYNGREGTKPRDEDSYGYGNYKKYNRE